MKLLLACLLGLLSGLGARAAAPDVLAMPDFPAPPLSLDRKGRPAETSAMGLLRNLHSAGVRALDNFEAVDSDYAVLASDSLARLTTWLEAACTGVGVDLAQARTGQYDGGVYARLLGVATSIAASRDRKGKLAIPVGVLICKRTQPWGAVPGDGNRDAYVLFATEVGLMVYDPPSRQLSTLGDFPNKLEVLRVRL